MELVFEVVVEAPREEVFRFHADPSHLAILNRDRPAFRLLRHDGDIRPGCTTWIEERIAGCLPVVLGFRHTICDPPHRFAEELVRGPYQRFVHIHEFEERPGGTLVRDRLSVSLPWAFGGEAGVRLVAAPMIRRAFAIRHRRLRQLAGEGAFAKMSTIRG